MGPCLHLLPTHNPCSAVWCCCCAGKKGGVANGAASPATSDEQQEQEEEDSELAALMPHLAYCLASPSASGTSSPVPQQSAPAMQPMTAGTQRLSGLGPNAEAANALQTAFAAAGANGPQGQQAEGYTPADLVQAVDFHLQMFTNLKREVGARCLLSPMNVSAQPACQLPENVCLPVSSLDTAWCNPELELARCLLCSALLLASSGLAGPAGCWRCTAAVR